MAKVPSPKTSRKGSPPALSWTVANLDKLAPSGLTPMNFKVRVEFHREFKAYAALRGISMVDLLQEGFRLVKDQRSR
jgi:hypothetical protein